MKNRNLFRLTLAGGTGGVFAGILLGIIETLALLLLGDSGLDLAALLWTMAAYGTLGLLAGLGLGFFGALLLWRWLPTDECWWIAISWALVFCGAGFIVLRFRLMRDLLQQRESLFSTMGLITNLALLLVFGLIFAGTILIARRWIGQDDEPKKQETPEEEVDVSRRDFLKVAFTGGVAVLPAAYLGSRLLSTDQGGSLTTVHRTGLPPNLQRKPNIILIVADTLRADHLGSYGYASAKTPYLDALAADSIQFDKMFAQSSWTKPSFASLFTSLYPSSHNTNYKSSVLPASAVTLAEVLSAGGYVSGGFANNVNIAPLFNFNQGFSHYEFLNPDYLYGATEASSQTAVYQTARMVNERFLQARKVVQNFYQPAEIVNQVAFDWLRPLLDERFFLFLHYMEPHDPYFEHPYNNYGIARVSSPNPPAELAPEMIRLYDGEISHLDERIGELVDWLKEEGRYDDTVIILTGDHGEEFYEHGGWWHGLTLFEEQIHVPLLVKLPGSQGAGSQDQDFARMIDIGPTLIRLAGLEIPSSMQGLDLFGDTPRTELIFAEGDHEGNIMQAIRGQTWKLIEANQGNPRGLDPVSLFNLVEDPQEQQNLASSAVDKVASLSTQLDDVAALALAQAIGGDQTELDEATQARLKSLGY